MRKNILQHIGAIVSGKRNEEHLTQQQLAQQTGRGLRHIQNIEKGRVNASIEVLADVIYRLGLSADVLFYPDMPLLEQQTKQLLCKFAVCKVKVLSARLVVPDIPFCSYNSQCGRLGFIDFYSKLQISQKRHRITMFRQNNKQKCHKAVTFEKSEENSFGFSNA